MAATALARTVAPSMAPASRVSTARTSSTTVSLAKAFGLRSPSMGRVTCMAVHKVTLKTPDGDFVVDFDDTSEDDFFILDAAEEANIELPYSCRAGACSSCAGLVTEGSINQDGQSFLDDEQIGKGFCLTCVVRPTSDCTIETHKEEDLV